MKFICKREGSIGPFFATGAIDFNCILWFDHYIYNANTGD